MVISAEGVIPQKCGGILTNNKNPYILFLPEAQLQRGPFKAHVKKKYILNKLLVAKINFFL